MNSREESMGKSSVDYVVFLDPSRASRESFEGKEDAREVGTEPAMEIFDVPR